MSSDRIVATILVAYNLVHPESLYLACGNSLLLEPCGIRSAKVSPIVRFYHD